MTESPITPVVLATELGLRVPQKALEVDGKVDARVTRYHHLGAQYAQVVHDRAVLLKRNTRDYGGDIVKRCWGKHG